ncbi:MAG TPA: hypothetical protein VII75_10125 [Thermoanaerobaculia bacterium]
MNQHARKWLDDELLDELRRINPFVGEPGERLVLPDALSQEVSPDQLARVLARLRKQASGASTQPLLALRLSARKRPHLFSYLQRMGRFAVESYRTIRLLDFGSESLIFLSEDISGNLVAIKLPFIDFTDLARIDVQQVRRRRNRLAREAETLARLDRTALPRLIASWQGINPLFPSALPPFLREQERFLALEYLPGARVDACASALRRIGRSCCVTRLAVAFVEAFVDLSLDIQARLGAGVLYTDIKPENGIVQPGGIRIVDASSIVEINAATRNLPISELYLHPVDHREWLAGRLLPSSGFILRTAVRAARSLVDAGTLFVGEDLPSWPQTVRGDVVDIFDSLASIDDSSLEEASAILGDLMERASCDHGSTNQRLTAGVPDEFPTVDRDSEGG